MGILQFNVIRFKIGNDFSQLETMLENVKAWIHGLHLKAGL